MKLPTYMLHKSTGQARVQLNGRDFYLGTYNTPESRERYDRLIAEWLANGRQIPAEPTPEPVIAEIVLAFIKHAQAYYPARQGTTTVQNMRATLKYLTALYSRLPASQFGPTQLKAVRESMITAGLSRPTVNDYTNRIRLVFQWASIETGLIPRQVYHDIRAVAPLKRGRTEARETHPVLPVPEPHIDALRAHLNPVQWAMIQVQRWTGMRPGELVIMRPMDIDQSRTVWVYTPTDHKNKHRGKSRLVFIGPRAQSHLSPLIVSPLDQWCFNSERTGRRYSVSGYFQFIRAACVAAKVPHWGPGRLRHNAGTVVRRERGLEAAQSILGHSKVETTQIYAESSHRLAEDVALQFG